MCQTHACSKRLRQMAQVSVRPESLGQLPIRRDRTQLGVRTAPMAVTHGRTAAWTPLHSLTCSGLLSELLAGEAMALARAEAGLGAGRGPLHIPCAWFPGRGMARLAGPSPETPALWAQAGPHWGRGPGHWPPAARTAAGAMFAHQTLSLRTKAALKGAKGPLSSRGESIVARGRSTSSPSS